jgi:hypothetical protein
MLTSAKLYNKILTISIKPFQQAQISAVAPHFFYFFIFILFYYFIFLLLFNFK